MVFESRIAEMLQNQASRFLRGFSGEQLKIGLLSGRLELVGLALNAEPLDSLLLESEVPLVMKAGVLMSAVTQIALLQGELELVIDGLVLVLGPACRWLTRTEVFSHRLNEIQRLEFVHMRSQCQRRTLEREMFRQLFSDYLSRLKVSVRNVHIRIEIEGEVDSSAAGRNRHACFGIVLGSCDITPVKGVVMPPDKDKDPSQSELLLAESIQVKNLSLYHEPSDRAKLHVMWSTYYNTRNRPLGVFDEVKQERFVKLMDDSRKMHSFMAVSSQFMPPADFNLGVELRSQPIRDGFHTDSCLTMEITVKLTAPSRLQLSICILEHLQWFVRRTLDFQLWQFLHPVRDPPERSTERWAILREFIALKRRIHSNSYALKEAIMMRINCKEYVRLYKKKFNGRDSVVQWRKSLPALTHGDAMKLNDIELVYPADKLVNFRLMAHAELKTEMALNSFLNSDESGASGQYRRAARELTPLEQLHLHGQHGYGVNIYRGLPAPPSSLKIRIDIQASYGLWWICRLSGKTSDTENCWTVAMDCTAQPLRVLLVDSIVDASVFATIEVPKVSRGQRPCGILLGKTATAFAAGSPGRSDPKYESDVSSGGKGSSEWCSIFELDGPIYCCSQLKTVLTSSPSSPWDIFVHMSCGDTIDMPGGQNPLDGFGTSAVPQRAHSTVAGTGGDTDSCVRLRIPFTLASGQVGPLVTLLQQCLVSTRSPSGKLQAGFGPNHSGIAWLVHRIGATRDVAIFRLHVRLPPVDVQAVAGGPSMALPRFDGACHLEHGGLIDGFIVGLHHLRHFAASLVSAASPTTPSEQSNNRGGSHRSSGATPWSLQPLEQSPPCMLIMVVMALAFAIATACRPQAKSGTIDLSKVDVALISLIKKHDLAGIVGKGDGSADPESPIASVTLLLTLFALIVGRRVLWNERDSRPGGPDISGSSMEGSSNAAIAVAEIHRLAGSMMRVLLVMGFPLHPRCLPLAAWCGAVEILEAASKTSFVGAPWPPSGLAIWAARGAYANLQARQDEVVRWLLRQQARIDEVDKSGRSLLDWSCWGGAEALTSLALRAGLLSETPTASGIAPVDMSSPSKSTSTHAPPPALLRLPLVPPSPLTMAVAGRSQRVVAMLLRAAGDPHAPARGGSCGPLLLAVRTCEYDLGCQVLRDAAFVSVDAALGPMLSSSTSSAQNGAVSMKAMENSSDSAPLAGCNVRATVALVDSLRRFAGSLSRRSTEDYGANTPHVSRSHLPGPHPDEGLYSTGQMQFSDILHPLVVQLPLPLHKVGHEFRPHPPPHRWLRRGTVNPWSCAQRFIECCIKRDFRPDSAVVTRALPALPPEARSIVQQLLLGASPSEGIFNHDDGISPNGAGALWFGNVLGNDTEDRRRDHPDELPRSNYFKGSSDFTPHSPEGKELSAAISFAKEIRELRIRPSSPDGVPPLDIAAALGADGNSDGDDRSRGFRGRGVGPSHRIQASPGLPTVWVTVALGGTSSATSPVSLDALRIHNDSLTLKLRDASGRTLQALHLQDIASIRQFELSGFEGPEMKSIVEVRLRPEADASLLAENLLYAAAVPTRNDFGSQMGSGSHIVNLVFLRAEDAEQFAATLQSSWQSLEGEIGDVAQEVPGRGDDIASFLQGGPWDPGQLLPCMKRATECLRATSSASLPKMRAVVIGPPRSGKTRVAGCILSQLGRLSGAGISREGESGPAWLRETVGIWPETGSPRAEVHVWDGSAAPMPGLLSRLMAESSVPIFLIIVIDASLVGLNTPMDAFTANSVAEASSSSSSAPRKVLVIENAFSDRVQGQSASKGSKAIRCNLRDAQSVAELQRTVGTLLAELTSDVEARRRSASEPTRAPILGSDDWSMVVSTLPQLPPPVLQAEPTIDSSLSCRLRGDTSLLDPAAVTWAWALIRASHGCLAEGSSNFNAGGTVVLWERLERVLAVANDAEGPDAAPILLRAMADLGLICPIPSLGVGTVALGKDDSSTCSVSTSVLVPDFARRIRLTSVATLQQACGDEVAQGIAPPAGGAVPGMISARLMWDAPNTAPPSLRSALRDFLTRAVLGTTVGPSAASALQFEIRRFVTLEAGPSGVTSATDSLSCGFVLIFALVPRSAEGELQTGGPGSPVSKPPASVRDVTPGGQSFGTPSSSMAAGLQSDDDLILSGKSGGERLNVLVVGASCEARKNEKPFWDVHCLGPNTQWTCRMFFGYGTSGLNFVRASANKVRSTSSSSSAGAWPLPAPVCVLSQVEDAGGRASPVGPEFASFLWLFSRPQGAATRSGMTEGNGNAACCCNCSKGGAASAGSNSEDGLRPQASLKPAGFEAALLGRSWIDTSRYLDEALVTGPEAWSLYAAVLIRMAHDCVAAVAGATARMLPLLTDTTSGGVGMGGTTRAVALVPEGPLPLAIGTRLKPPGATLGQMRSGPGVEGWLRLCRPAALWSAAGASRGFSAASGDMLTACGSGNVRVGDQVSEALKVATSVQLTSETVAEVWRSLAELEASQNLFRRAGGTWVQLADGRGGSGFLL